MITTLIETLGDITCMSGPDNPNSRRSQMAAVFKRIHSSLSCMANQDISMHIQINIQIYKQ